jgi:hypothetical protein
MQIVRHPCATIYSWISDPDEFPKAADPLQEWRTGRCRKTGREEFWGFDDWIRVTRQAVQLEKRYPGRFRILRYEDLVKDAHTHVKSLFEFLQLPLQKPTLDFIALSQSRHQGHKHAVYKVSALQEKWEEKLDSAVISECLAAVEGTELERFLAD